MNDSNEKYTEINGRIKKVAIALSSLTLVLSVMALAARSDRNVTAEETTTVPVTQDMEVENKVENEPDTGRRETIVVPATQVTTESVTQEVVVNSQETDTESAPVSYILPLGTDIGFDYSCGMPVYNEVMDDWRSHDGVDFNGESGDGVKAMADGIVRKVESDPMYESIITVDHGGGVVASYCGVIPGEDIMAGVIVTQGEKLGEICEIPCESDAVFDHLHLEIRVDGELADPLEVMGYYE